jgi:hypothetical protein
MKCLKEPLARLANRQEQTRGAFFEGRFKHVAILAGELPAPGGVHRAALTGKAQAYESGDGQGVSTR